MTTTLRALAALTAGLILVACGGTEKVAITVTPGTAAVATGGSTAFTAAVTGTTKTGVLWLVKEAGGGTITSAGVYTAPHTAGSYTVVAAAAADTSKTAEATVTVTAVGVTITPATMNLTPGSTATFVGAVTGSVDTGITWTVEPAGSGSVTAAGFYTAPTTSGTYAVVATSTADPTRSARATINVRNVMVTITPGSATLDQGGTLALSATVANSTNNAVNWSVATGGGSISTDGHYTAPFAAGSYTITATSASDATRTASIIVLVRDVAITLSPSTVPVSIGATASFTATVTGTVNKSVAWSVAGTPAGTITTAGVYTAPGTAATNTVTATSVADNTKTASATVVVNAVAVSISPALITVDQGETTSFAATVNNGGGNTAVTWSVSGGGTITPGGSFTAGSTAGSFTVVATSVADGSRSGSATVVVRSVAISVSPSSTAVAAGANATFTATVTGSVNHGVSWSVAGSPAGAITAGGVFTAPLTGGTNVVTATSSADATKKASATVTVQATSVLVSPKSVTLDQGATQVFTSLVTNASNTTVTWSVSPAGGGSVAADGTFTAGTTAGTVIVTATSNADATRSDSAVVTVRHVAISISPVTVSVNAGATQTFSATVTGTTNTAVNWQVGSPAAGAIDSTGVYTASSTAGIYTVTAVSAADSTQSATATVTVLGANALTYADPPAGGWRLVRNAAQSTATHLVLDLVGASGDSGRGVGLTLHTDASRVSWAKVAPTDTEYVANRAFALGTGTQLVKGLVQGADLKAGVFQKGVADAAVNYDAAGALIGIALDLRGDAGLVPGANVLLSVTASQALPASGAMANINVGVGVISASVQ